MNTNRKPTGQEAPMTSTEPITRPVSGHGALVRRAAQGTDPAATGARRTGCLNCGKLRNTHRAGYCPSPTGERINRYAR